jgi:hypothetical protein
MKQSRDNQFDICDVSCRICPVIIEWILSLAVWVGFIISRSNATWYLAAWLATGIVTGIARYIGNITRRECRDLRFMFYSLHNKIPFWINWLFWLTILTMLVKPFFAVPIYVSVVLAFQRGYRDYKNFKLFWITLIIDCAVRMVSSLLLIP